MEGYICQALAPGAFTSAATGSSRLIDATRTTAWRYARQGLTLLHFSAERKRCLWYWGRVQGLFRESFGGVRGCQGVFGCVFVADTA